MLLGRRLLVGGEGALVVAAFVGWCIGLLWLGRWLGLGLWWGRGLVGRPMEGAVGVYAAGAEVRVAAAGAEVCGVGEDAVSDLLVREALVGEEACEGGDVGGRHARAVHVPVAAGEGGEDADAGGGDVHPVAHGGEGGAVVVAVGCGDGDGVGVGGGVLDGAVPAVARGGDDDGALVPGVVHRLLQEAGGGRAGEGEVDDVGPVVRGPHYALGDVGVVADPAL